MSRFSICSVAPPLPASSLLASWILISIYKAEDLSGEEESNKSTGVGEQEPGCLLLEEGTFTWGVAWGEGAEAGGMAANL